MDAVTQKACRSGNRDKTRISKEKSAVPEDWSRSPMYLYM